MVAGYARAATRLGVRFAEHTEVFDISTGVDGVHTITTQRGTVRADAVVIAAGAWSTTLGAGLGVHLPIEGVRRQIGFTAQQAVPHPTVPFTLDLSTTLYFHNYRNGLLLGISNRDEEPGMCREFSYGWTRAFDAAASVVAPSTGPPAAGRRLGRAVREHSRPQRHDRQGRGPRSVLRNRVLRSRILAGAGGGGDRPDLYLGREPFMDPTPFSADRFDRTSGHSCSPKSTSSELSTTCRKADPLMTTTTERISTVSLGVRCAPSSRSAWRRSTARGPRVHTLVDVSREVNEDFIAANRSAAERLGSIDRVTAERHGAIRVGSPRELAQVARVFAGFGMHPVGFYDLRDASTSSVPVVSTAFRPIDADELARNPFRVFTSMLVTATAGSSTPTPKRGSRRSSPTAQLFAPELLELADRSVAAGRPGRRRTRIGSWSWRPRRSSCSPSRSTSPGTFTLEAISAVAADIGGVPSTHINHLTPRVLDIDDLYARMCARASR